ncbi:MAG TPA: M81 family metallopeptidase, partial [Prosthecobacter sp.]
MPRILIAGLFHETHTFLEGVTPLSDFQIRRGVEMLACKGDSSPLGGVLELADEFGWEIVPAADYRAQPSPTVADEVVEAFW